MTITITEQATPGSIRALLLAGKATFAEFAVYKDLAAADRRYVSAALDNEHRMDFARLFTLPSGTPLLVIQSEKSFTHRSALRAVRRVIRLALEERIAKVALDITPLKTSAAYSEEALLEAYALQAMLASYDFRRFKTAPKKGWFTMKRLEFIAPVTRAAKLAVQRGMVIGEEANAARELANTPGGSMTPAVLAQHAQELGVRAGFSVRVLDVKEMEALGMGGVLGVGQGSSTPPRFIVAEYFGAGADAPVTVLAGKGVTFDTGGLNLKPSTGIYEMHLDMSGGAYVLHTLAALARLKVTRNVVALVPAVENMPSGSSYRPGDQLRTLNGKTIEVLNTDAEGRVILADAFAYAERYKPEQVIDVATLTGAAMVALGHRLSALFTPDDALAEALVDAGYQSGDYAWRMPLWEEFEPEVQGTFGDVANIGKHAPHGGAITAAIFLWQFAKQYRWAHLDIAPRMTATDDECLAKGAAGASVPMLVTYLSR